MNLRLKLAASVIALATLATVGAQAATLYSNPTSTGELAVDTSLNVAFDAPVGGLGTLSFVLDGYHSLDGQNWYEDDFTLSLNGTDIFKGTFNLGGGGNDAVFLNLGPSAYSNVSGNGTNITWAGGHVNFTTPLALNVGSNSITFNYHALPSNGGQNAGWQDMGDEGWGVSNVQVSGAVPEPAAWALMLTGFFGVGAMVRRSRQQLVRVTA
jgi:prepilin-type processing-associated H-X9-DG protein